MKQLVNAPLGDFIAHDIDTAADTKYYGFLALDGRWIIQQEITSAGTFRFAAGVPTTGGSAEYTAAWTGRAALDYDYATAVLK